ncbi:hypothetical protein CVT25_009830 [Psilocybe cyanescens]|uniref:Transmembrane protein n=1 Tax=Psilocybe cyanescens TaxID=93625 RepID=A0A409X848_PSICY|nr:hypothetical protein CVT25_009830 [Psilocybe cyanescens]
MATPVGAIVDDSDPAVRYSEGWLANTSVTVGPNGQIPLYNSLHVAQSNSDFSFSFNGSFVSVMGSMLPSSLPRWSCFIDGVELLSVSFTDGQEHLPLCSQSLGDGHHTITVLTNATQDSPFWLDYIQYDPSSSENTDDVDKVFNPGTAAVMVGKWTPLLPSGSGVMTRDKSSKVQVQFNGVSLTWLGVYNNNVSGPSTTATYTINGSNPVTFPVNNFASNSTPVMFDQIVFQTANYPRGLHNLEVTYEGDSHMAPLTLKSLIVQNITEPRSTPASSNTSSPSAIPSATISPSNSGSNHRPHASGPIAGGAVGGFLLLIITSLCLILWKRRKSKSGLEPFGSLNVIQPFNDTQYRTSDSCSSSPTNSKASGITIHTSPGLRGDLLLGKQQRINEVITSNLRLHIPSMVPSIPTTSSLSATSSRSPEVRMHEDSGLRLSQPEHANVIDIPPIYSPV